MNNSTQSTSFEKVLSANDTSATGAHMGGILIPKTEFGLIALFPKLDPKEYNPSVFINVFDANGTSHKLRYVYYNNKLHKKGTRNEYRLTHLTNYIRNFNAQPGDRFRISLIDDNRLEMMVIKQKSGASERVILRGWNRVH
jgi:hypothetical protein